MMRIVRTLKQAVGSTFSRAAVLVGSALLTLGCVQKLFYQPDNIVYDSPAKIGLKYEQVTLTSHDGTRLAGWFVPASGVADPRQAKGTVIYFHGNAQNISAHWGFVNWLPQQGFNVFLFDYRGYGNSEGTPSPKGVFEDSDSALNYLRARKDIDPEKLLVFGQSLGGANAIAVVGAGNRAGVKAIAIEAAFYSYSSIANDKFSGAGYFMDDTYSPANYIAKLTPMPFLLLHGTADGVVPYTHAQALYNKAQNPKRLVTVLGGGHIAALTPWAGSTYRSVLTQFFDTALANK